MAFIADDLPYITVRISGKTSSGDSVVGTGFYFNYEDRVFIVTNKHVVDDIIDGFFLLKRANVKNNQRTANLGEGIQVNITKDNFIGHPDPKIDVSVMNLSDIINELESNGDYIFLKWITSKTFPNAEQVETFISSLEEVTFVGYPIGIWDTENLLPILRKGITATPFSIDFEGKKQFLIDASVFPGSSGSPVFMYSSGTYHDNKGGTHIGSLLFFLGILAKVYIHNEEGDIIVEEAPTQLRAYVNIEQKIDLGIVLKNNVIVEAANHYIDKVLNGNK